MKENERDHTLSQILEQRLQDAIDQARAMACGCFVDKHSVTVLRATLHQAIDDLLAELLDTPDAYT